MSKKKRQRPQPPDQSANTDDGTRIFLYIFGSVSLLMIAIAIISGVMSYQQLTRERKAPGRVLDMTLRDSISEVDRVASADRHPLNSVDKKTRVVQEFYYPIVEFNLANGQTKTLQLGEGSWPPAYEKGEAVTVIYEADKPKNAYIESTSSKIMRWFVPMLTGGLGLIFMAVVITVTYWDRPKLTPE
jgi:Protein of unknown function (DUF3592)